MKGKQLLILLILLVVLGAAGFFLQKRNQSSWSESGAGAGTKVVEFPINDVTHIVVKNQTSFERMTIGRSANAPIIRPTMSRSAGCFAGCGI
jgi:cell shape-determining protein MreC